MASFFVLLSHLQCLTVLAKPPPSFRRHPPYPFRKAPWKVSSSSSLFSVISSCTFAKLISTLPMWVLVSSSRGKAYPILVAADAFLVCFKLLFFPSSSFISVFKISSVSSCFIFFDHDCTLLFLSCLNFDNLGEWILISVFGPSSQPFWV